MRHRFTSGVAQRLGLLELGFVLHATRDWLRLNQVQKVLLLLAWMVVRTGCNCHVAILDYEVR